MLALIEDRSLGRWEMCVGEAANGDANAVGVA